MQESPVHAVKGIPAYAGMPVFGITHKLNLCNNPNFKIVLTLS